MKVTEKYYQLNDIRLHVLEAGDPNGPVLLLLHGFPEYSYGWRKQIPYFAEKGYRIVAPDQRGYHLSSKPAGIRAYQMKYLVADIVGLIGQLGVDKVRLVGHDWGGGVAWSLAALHPELLEKLVILNLPHPLVMKKALKNWPAQMLRSWYIGFFQLPFLPEMACRAFNFKLLEEGMRRSALPATFSNSEMDQYKKAWQQPGALRSMINWYRAGRHSSFPLPPQIETPSLLIWGKKDGFLSHHMAQPSIDLCRDGRLKMLNEATHWLQHEKAPQVNKLIEAFIR